MSNLGASRQAKKRKGQNTANGKMAMNLDLNCHPEAESLLSEDFPDSRHHRNPQETSFSSVPQPSHAPRPQQGISTLPDDRLGSGVIDLESDEDEVKILSCSREFPKGRNHSRRKQPGTLVLDEDSGMDEKQAGEPVARSSLHTHNKLGRCSTSRAFSDRHIHPEEEFTSKMKNAMEPEKETTKESTLICPVCMDSIVQASSTSCGHIFCFRCIKACVEERKKCPTCGRKLNKNNFHRIYFPASE